MLRKTQDGKCRRTWWLWRRDQAVLSFVKWWSDFATRVGAYALFAKQRRYVWDDEAICYHYKPPDPFLVHSPLILQIQTLWPRLLWRLSYRRNSKELLYYLSRTARRIHAILHHRALFRVRSLEDCMYLHH